MKQQLNPDCGLRVSRRDLRLLEERSGGEVPLTQGHETLHNVVEWATASAYSRLMSEKLQCLVAVLLAADGQGL